jgi:hypothetical protein
MGGYTAEELAQLSDIELDDVIEAIVMGRQPEPGLLPRLLRNVVRRYGQVMGTGDEPEALAYSSSHAGMGLVIDKIVEKGFTVAIAPGGVVWVAGAGREMKYVGGGSLATPRNVAIAAVLAVQGA